MFEGRGVLSSPAVRRHTLTLLYRLTGRGSP